MGCHIQYSELDSSEIRQVIEFKISAAESAAEFSALGAG